MASFRLVGAWAVLVLGVGLGSSEPAPGAVEPVVGAPAPREAIGSGQVVAVDGRPIEGAAVFAGFDAGVDPLDDPTALDEAVVGQSQTDPAGRFRIVWPGVPTLAGATPMLWAYHPGHRVVRVEMAAGPSEVPARIVLPPEVRGAMASVRVVGPGGEPVAGAVVRPIGWYEGGVAAESARTGAIPAPLAERLGATTDGEGRVVLAGITALHLAGVAVASPRLGVQFAGWEPGQGARSRLAALHATGRVVGRLGGPGEPDQLRAGWSVVAMARGRDSRALGRVGTTTDPTGRFVLDGVAAGMVEVRAVPPPGSAEIAARTICRDLAVGGSASVEIPVRPGVRVAGVVVTRDGEIPVANASVAVAGPGESVRRVETDAAGRFAAVVRDGSVRVRVEVAPVPLLVSAATGAEGPGFVSLADHRDPADLRLVLDRGVMIPGRVDPAGPDPTEPAGMVVARWTARDDRGRLAVPRVSRAAIAADGTFALGPFPAGVAANLVVVDRPEGEPGPAVQVAAVAGMDPVHLAHPPATPGPILVGRVVDALGRPAPGALIQFRVAGPTGDPAGAVPDRGHRVTARGLDAVVADAEGRFRVPTELTNAGAGRRWLASAEIAEEAWASPEIGSMATAEPGELRFPPIELSPAPERGAVVGRVVGTDGRAIAGAVVRDLADHRATSDETGHFRLDRVAGRGVPPVVLVACDGFRRSGAVLERDAGRIADPLTLTLARDDEPVAGAAVGDRLACELAGRLVRAGIVATGIDRILARRDPVATAALLEHLAESDPGRVEALLQRGVVTDSRVADGLRAAVARRLAASDLAGADAVLDAIEAPATRAHARLAVAARAPGLTADQRRDRVERVGHDVRAIHDLGRRVEALGEVAAAWLDLDRSDRARTALDEAQAVAETLPRATAGLAAWCALAGPLARLDPAAAEARLDALADPRAADRCRLAIARDLAGRDPADAVRFFRRVRDAKLRLAATAELAHRIAPRDPALARSLIDPIRARHPVEAAHALGMMAHALAATDRPAALLLLRAAFDRLEAAAHAGTTAATRPAGVEPAHAAALLLLAAEAVDPALVPEFLWLSVSLHRPEATGVAGAPVPSRSVALLAALLHRHDPAAALALFDPRPIDPSDIPPAEFPALLAATARIAPDCAARWVAPGVNRDRHLMALIAALAPAQGPHDGRHLLHLWAPEAVAPSQP